MKSRVRALPIALLAIAVLVCPLLGAQQAPLLTAMKTELDRSFKALANADSIPLSFLA